MYFMNYIYIFILYLGTCIKAYSNKFTWQSIESMLYAMLCYANAKLCYANAMLSYAMLCYAMLCYAMLC